MLDFCRFACGSAPAYGSADAGSSTSCPALIPPRALRESGTDWVTFCRAWRRCRLAHPTTATRAHIL